jgi:Flp pilus assembly protein TadB
MKKVMIILLLIGLFSFPIPARAIETTPRITERELAERLTRLEEGQKRLEEGQKAILREMDKRFEAVDKRFEAVDKRFEAVEKRFDQLINVFIAIVAAFAGIVAVTIGFALWDRRTMIRPFEIKVKAIESDIVEDRKKIQSLIDSLRSIAKTDEKIAEILKRFNLL